MIVQSHAALVALSAAIFLMLALGGFLLLRRVRQLGMRVFAFLLFCYACVSVTLWTAKLWRLYVGEVAAAWVVALLLFAILEIIRLRRVGKRVINAP